jgi:hypothetical protein
MVIVGVDRVVPSEVIRVSNYSIWLLLVVKHVGETCGLQMRLTGGMFID